MVTAFRRLFIRVGDQECAGGQPDHLAEVTELLLERQRPAFREREVRRSENGRFGLRRVKLQPDRPPAGAAPVVVVDLLPRQRPAAVAVVGEFLAPGGAPAETGVADQHSSESEKLEAAVVVVMVRPRAAGAQREQSFGVFQLAPEKDAETRQVFILPRERCFRERFVRRAAAFAGHAVELRREFAVVGGGRRCEVPPQNPVGFDRTLMVAKGDEVAEVPGEPVARRELGGGRAEHLPETRIRKEVIFAPVAQHQQQRQDGQQHVLEIGVALLPHAALVTVYVELP